MGKWLDFEFCNTWREAGVFSFHVGFEYVNYRNYQWLGVGLSLGFWLITIRIKL